MNEDLENADKFQDAIEWAMLGRRLTKPKGIPIFYLVLGSLLVLVLLVMIIYLFSSEKKDADIDADIDALDMMQDEQYIYDNPENNNNINEDEYTDEEVINDIDNNIDNNP